MQSRREFLIMAGIASVSVSVLVMVGSRAFAQAELDAPKAATAITQVFGDGVKFTAIAIEYVVAIKGAALSAVMFKVDGRTVTGAFTATSVDPADRADHGRFVIVTLSVADANAALAEKIEMQGKNPSSNRRRGPGNAGDVPFYDTIYRLPEAKVFQVEPIMADNNISVPASNVAMPTIAVKNLVVDDFQQLEFHDQKTNRILQYNLFVPPHYDETKNYPLVLFMHDAGATSDVTRTTLFQGLGAIAWASPLDQAKRPCFVLAPQFAEIIADDQSHTSDMLDTTINLVKALTEQYHIDANRLYVTGQSGGCMMSIAMNIKYADFFAASFLVAGQWDPNLVKPLAKAKLWILVSQDDDKAFPGQNAITEMLATEGAKIGRAVWNGTWTDDQFRFAFDALDSEQKPINYVTFRQGTVIPEGTATGMASGHRNTWRIAYTIEPIREWIFRQRKAS